MAGSCSSAVPGESVVAAAEWSFHHPRGFCWGGLKCGREAFMDLESMPADGLIIVDLSCVRNLNLPKCMILIH